MKLTRCHKSIFIFFSAFFIIVSFTAQSFCQKIAAKKTDSSIKIDGILNENEWKTANVITGFTQFEPIFGEPASLKTIVKVMYNGQYIYFGIECLDSDPSKISSKVTRRDGEVWEDDAVALIIDTFNDDNNAYMFTVNSLGTQQDERWADNGRTRDIKWDVRWLSAGTVTNEGWTAEVAIPFEVLKFSRETQEWGFDVIRYIPRNLEMSHWIKNLTEWFRISEFGAIFGLDLQEVSGKRYTLIPYIQSQLEKGAKSTGDVGGDIRVNLSSNLGLDGTINPDFATIEGDVEQINLTRFELSYPEKRPFFMEGAENYSTRIRQFYSRRIGEIPWGIKLNGKINRWKLNVLATQSDPSTANPQIESGNDAIYSVFRINREIANASNIGVIGANRSYSGDNKGSVGLVSTLFFTKLLGMTSQVIKSYGDSTSGTWTYFFRPSYDSKTGHFHIRYTHVGENVRENMNDIGFIRDDDRREVDSNIRKQFWINKSGFEDISAGINYNQYWSQTNILRSWEVRNSLDIKFLKKWEFSLKYIDEFKRYEKDFRNNEMEAEIDYENKMGNALSFSYGTGKNFDSVFEQLGSGIDLKLREGWNISYNIKKFWFDPDIEDENSIIHYFRSTFYMNKDMFFKLFYQSKYNVAGGISDPDFDLSRETIQFVFVWRFLPPFGAIQFAFQQGSTRHTDVSGDQKTLFTKLSWVF